MLDEKLQKIVNLAKGGDGGEKDNAIRIIKRICKREGLFFDDVMNESKASARTIEHRRGEATIVLSVVCRYAFDNWEEVQSLQAFKYRGGGGAGGVEFKSTDANYINTLNALDVLLKAWKNEKKALLDNLDDAFRVKHVLYYLGDRPEKVDDEEEEKPKDKKKTLQVQALSSTMEDVEIHKQIGNGK